jgi:hypothetical protein
MEYTYATIELRMLFPVARQREAPMKSLSGNNVAGCLAMTDSQQYGQRLFSMLSLPRLYHPRYKYNRQRVTRVEAGSNTSIMTLRVVGGDEKGSLKLETVKYGRKFQGTWPEKDCAGKGQQHIQKADPSSRQGGRPTKTRHRNCQTAINIWSWAPDGGSTPRLTVSRNVTLTLTNRQSLLQATVAGSSRQESSTKFVGECGDS